MHNKRNKYRLVVITVTYKPDLTELKAFIDSFYKYNDLGDEAKLIIVDNSPSDYHHVKSLASQYNLSYKSCPNNPGFGTANNIGFELFDSEYALFINNDTEFIEPLFKKLIRIHESNNSIGCIGIHQLGGAPSFFKKFTTPYYIKDNDFSDEHHIISGAFMFFKSNVFKKCGKFDEQIFMYLEEFDIAKRLNNIGFTTHYCSTLKFLHKAKKRKNFNKEKWEIGANSHFYICKKHKIDPCIGFKEVNKRLKKFQLYYLFQLKFKSVLKIHQVLKYRKKLMKRNEKE